MTRGDASLKGKIKAMAKKSNLKPQELLQMYLFEHLLMRLEKSDYAETFVLKGGLLISSMTGIAQRTTMDMDATGDEIVPGLIEYRYPLMFEEGSMRVLSYPLETVLAEKLETVVSRGIANTRGRDFYDIHGWDRQPAPHRSLGTPSLPDKARPSRGRRSSP